MYQSCTTCLVEPPTILNIQRLVLGHDDYRGWRCQIAMAPILCFVKGDQDVTVRGDGGYATWIEDAISKAVAQIDELEDRTACEVEA